jgi:LmbE family N-acetylglucosaminyl deacetylase
MPIHYTALAELHTPYPHIYLSPHLDDAALSCGGSIARFVGSGDAVLVVNICSGSPPADQALSSFAQQIHARWGLSPATVVQQRLHEDITALETLGADSYQLDLLDAIYRCPHAYVDNKTLFGPVASDDQLAELILAHVEPLAARFPGAIFYAPLGIGNHVDHQATYAAALALAQRGCSVACYEDVPYATVPGALETRLAQLGGADLFLPTVTAIDATLARKVSAIEAYASQIGTLFGNSTAMERTIRMYAEALRPDSNTYGERIWVRR